MRRVLLKLRVHSLINGTRYPLAYCSVSLRFMYIYLMLRVPFTILDIINRPAGRGLRAFDRRLPCMSGTKIVSAVLQRFFRLQPTTAAFLVQLQLLGLRLKLLRPYSND